MSVARRIERAQNGNFGDSHSVGDGISEMRIDLGPGYRIYYTIRKQTIVILLAGGDKKTQTKDIRQAKQLAKEV